MKILLATALLAGVNLATATAQTGPMLLSEPKSGVSVVAHVATGRL